LNLLCLLSFLIIRYEINRLLVVFFLEILEKRKRVMHSILLKRDPFKSECSPIILEILTDLISLREDNELPIDELVAFVRDSLKVALLMEASDEVPKEGVLILD
jgi:hypothetical protein